MIKLTCAKKVVLVFFILFAVDNTELEACPYLKFFKIEQFLYGNLAVLSPYELCISVNSNEMSEDNK